MAPLHSPGRGKPEHSGSSIVPDVQMEKKDFNGDPLFCKKLHYYYLLIKSN